MNYATEYIVRTLKAAREGKGLSQRALSELAGVPQSHISKIENGAVDLRLSSLVELVRVLGLELTLVPRKSAAMVQSIIHSTKPESGTPTPSTAKELKRLHNTLSRITRENPAIKELAQLRREAREIQQLQLSIRDGEALRKINKTLQTFKDSAKGLDAIRDSAIQLKKLRNSIVHSLLEAKSVTPAYSLEEGEYG